MADFNLTQTDQQVQNILNDAQGAMGASAQTTLTTEYVMLKDTSGVYHKILKSSFTEAIRDVLAGLLVNNDKGTTINQIAAIASGDFGSITPANLASVLGGMQPKGHVYSIDANTITETSIYSVNDANFADHHLPSHWGILTTINTGGGDSVYSTYQKWLQADGTTEYTRLRSGGNWLAWKSNTLL